MQTPSRQSSRSEGAHGLVASSLDELSNQRKSVAGQFVKQFSSDASTAQEEGRYSIPDGETADDVGIRQGLSVEHALYHILCHGSGDPNQAYISQVRTVLYNLKKNSALSDGLLNGTITGQHLAKWSPEDMASREQQLRDAKLKQEQEKQHVIIQEQGPRIRRTHKGDEYVDETQQIAAEPDVINAPVRRRESGLDPDVSDMRSPIGTNAGGRLSPDRHPLSINTQARPRPSTEPERKSSQAFNIQDVWSSVQGSPDSERPAFPQIPYQTGGQPQKINQTEADADIDALLKDEEVESPPYSPKSFDGDNTTIWRGMVNMSPVTTFNATARRAAGAEIENLGLVWQQLIPAMLTIEGRIDPARADSYLCGLRYSSTSDVIVVSLRPAETPNDRQQFSVLFDYFKTRNRYGVGVNASNLAIKDIYLIPLEAGSERKPELLQLLDNDKIELPVQEDMLLVPFVIKTSELLNANSTPKEHQPIAASPITGTAPAVGGSALTPTQTGFPTATPPPSSAAAPSTQNQTQPLHQQQVPHLPVLPSPSPYPVPQPNLPNPTPPTTQSPTPSSVPPHPHPHPLTGAEAALYVLGPHRAHLPAVQQLLLQAPNAGILEMNVVGECLGENEAAGRDLSVLTEMLVKREERGVECRG